MGTQEALVLHAAARRLTAAVTTTATPIPGAVPPLSTVACSPVPAALAGAPNPGPVRWRGGGGVGPLLVTPQHPVDGGERVRCAAPLLQQGSRGHIWDRTVGHKICSWQERGEGGRDVLERLTTAGGAPPPQPTNQIGATN